MAKTSPGKKGNEPIAEFSHWVSLAFNKVSTTKFRNRNPF
ncbi:hypothetical protein ADIS_3471 [Lunatimonas lonarensis]|uniref:Uncharacterized protein n=1 Tax=Lunatimonas lonarensis TaxID=1232681 RepID=R7ZQL4_9BACT|nr:hypothetical protein ADIS_3471 [Lunatimonas lonarensis]